MNETLLVNRNDFQDTKTVSLPDAPLKDDHIRVSIGPFALTANNITYMVTGDMIGYWHFFDPTAYGLPANNMGRMPVWGYGVITESTSNGFAVGERIYGFFPIANSIDLQPIKVSNFNFQDGTEHRRPLHPIYNTYTRTENDPSFVPELDDIQPILRPLFTTSFLIDDFFGEEDFFGAEQIVLLSASSKTAMGTAFCLKKRGGVHVIGLTSPSNVDFTKSTGFYDAVQSYDNIAKLDPTKKTAIIDMAGNGDVNARMYAAFGENLVYNCMVGKSHWQGSPPPKPSKGAPPVMFFAPDQAKKRIAQWGGAGFAQNLAAHWVPFCQSAQSWLNISHDKGATKLLQTYNGLLDGTSDPSQGKLFIL